MPDMHRRVKLPVTSVDELFGTHTSTSSAPVPETTAGTRLAQAVNRARRLATAPGGPAQPSGHGGDGDGVRASGAPAVAWRRVRSILEAELSWNSPILRHAIRLAAATTTAEAIGRPVGDWGTWGIGNHGFWVCLTTALVLYPDYAETISRGVGRAAGSIAGALAGAALAPLHGSALLRAVILVLLLLGYLVFRSAGQPWLIVWIVAWVSYLIGSDAAAWTRGADTVLGAAIAMLAYLIWPTWHSKLLGRAFSRWTRLQADALDAVVAALPDPASANTAELRDIRARARDARCWFEQIAAHAAREPAMRGVRWGKAQLQAISAAMHEVSATTAMLFASLPELPEPGDPAVSG